MSAGAERDRLLGALDELSTELGYDAGQGLPEALVALESMGGQAYAGMLNGKDEALVAAISEALAKVVTAVCRSYTGALAPPPSAIIGALGGATMVMRGEIMAGHSDELPRLVPDFVYLVTLPFVGQEEALRLAQRTEELIEASRKD